MFQTKVVEKEHTFMVNNFFLKIEPFMRYVEKFGTAGRATDDSAVHALCMLDN
jgi:hypothetical protein